MGCVNSRKEGREHNENAPTLFQATNYQTQMAQEHAQQMESILPVLVDMFPHWDQETLANILEAQGGDLEAAAAILVSMGPDSADNHQTGSGGGPPAALPRVDCALTDEECMDPNCINGVHAVINQQRMEVSQLPSTNTPHTPVHEPPKENEGPGKPKPASSPLPSSQHVEEEQSSNPPSPRISGLADDEPGYKPGRSEPEPPAADPREDDAWQEEEPEPGAELRPEASLGEGVSADELDFTLEEEGEGPGEGDTSRSGNPAEVSLGPLYGEGGLLGSLGAAITPVQEESEGEDEREPPPPPPSGLGPAGGGEGGAPPPSAAAVGGQQGGGADPFAPMGVGRDDPFDQPSAMGEQVGLDPFSPATGEDDPFHPSASQDFGQDPFSPVGDGQDDPFQLPVEGARVAGDPFPSADFQGPQEELSGIEGSDPFLQDERHNHCLSSEQLESSPAPEVETGADFVERPGEDFEEPYNPPQTTSEVLSREGQDLFKEQRATRDGEENGLLHEPGAVQDAFEDAEDEGGNGEEDDHDEFEEASPVHEEKDVDLYNNKNDSHKDIMVHHNNSHSGNDGWAGEGDDDDFGSVTKPSFLMDDEDEHGEELQPANGDFGQPGGERQEDVGAEVWY